MFPKNGACPLPSSEWKYNTSIFSLNINSICRHNTNNKFIVFFVLFRFSTIYWYPVPGTHNFLSMNFLERWGEGGK